VDADTALPLSTAVGSAWPKKRPEQAGKDRGLLRAHQMLKADETLADIDVLLRVASEVERLLTNALDKADTMSVNVSQAAGRGRGSCFLNSHLEIPLSESSLPPEQHLRPLGRRHLWFCGLPMALSGRAGTTLPYAQEFLTGELRFQDALLLDNGGATCGCGIVDRALDRIRGRAVGRRFVRCSCCRVLTTGGPGSVSIQ